MRFWFVTPFLVAAVVSASVVDQRPEKKLADENFLKNQEQVLHLFSGIGTGQHWNKDDTQFDFEANMGSFTDEKYPKAFLEAYHRGFLPKEGILNIYCHKVMGDAIKLFDVFFFAKDLETFFKVAKWAKVNIHQGLYFYAFSHAIVHRSDTQSFVIPPLYEILPSLFVPAEALHQVTDAKMEGIKEKVVAYNSSGYEKNYYSNYFGGPLSKDNRGYGDFRVSYFREDVGLNNYIALAITRNPSWMDSEKYNTPWLKRRGENKYHAIQQLLARYNHEGSAAGVPFAEILEWNQPIKVGYNPRVTYLNGQSMYNRPDNLNPQEFNYRGVQLVHSFERRIWEVIDYGSIINAPNKSMISLKDDNGVDSLAKVYFGTYDRPNKPYYKSAYYAALDTLSYLTSTASDRSSVGNALSTPTTAARDPAFYNLLARVVNIFESFKMTLDPYTLGELSYSGVKIQDVEVDKFMTYFDRFEFDVTNCIPMQNKSDYKNYHYKTSSYRINHKPYNYNITVNSEQTGKAIVRVYLGQNFDSDMRVLTPNQARLTFYEIDRFVVELTSGVNVFERSSKESPFFVPQPSGFRELYRSVYQKTPFYISENGQCGMPENLQLPMGWAGGRPAQLFVAVKNYNREAAAPQNNKYDIACGGEALNDGRPSGFPFDKPFNFDVKKIPNFFFKDVHIYHKEHFYTNTPSST